MLLSPYYATVGVGSGGVSYFFEERFEGTGYQNSWTESGTGTIDEDYTGVILEGSQSLQIAAIAQNPNTTVVFASDKAELWGFFRIQVVTQLSVNRAVFRLRNSSNANVATLILNDDFGWQAQNGSNTSTVTVDKMTEDNPFNVWWHYVKGSGANGVMNVGFSATGTEVTSGNAFKQTSAGTATTDAHELVVGMTTTNTTGEYVIDKILISDTATIGNDPA